MRLLNAVIVITILNICPLWGAGREMVEYQTPHRPARDAAFTGIADGHLGLLSTLGVANALGGSGLLENIQEVHLDGAYVFVSGNRICLDNIRVVSDSTDFDDYLMMDFLWDLESLRLIPTKLEVIENLGTYCVEHDLFAKNVTTSLRMTSPQGGILRADTMYTITAGPQDEFRMYMEAGTVLTTPLRDPSDEYCIEIQRPDGELLGRVLHKEGSRWMTIWGDLLRTGEYRFRFMPTHDRDVTLQFGFTNNNRQPLRTLSNGETFSTSLNGWGHEYAKYFLHLRKGDLVEVDKIGGAVVRLRLVNDAGRNVSGYSNDNLFFRVQESGAHYLFVISDELEEGDQYSATVRITPDPHIEEYPLLDPVDNQMARQGDSFYLELTASKASAFRASGLPDDIVVEQTSGVISGTPAIAGTFPIAAWAENQYGSDRKDFFLTVEPNQPPCPRIDAHGGYFVTSDLWIKAEIGEPNDTVFHQSGEITDDAGSRFIWGYFYPTSACSIVGLDRGDPVVEARIWIDASGAIDVDFFNLSTVTVYVYSDYPYDGLYDQQGELTACSPYVHHEYVQR